MIQTKNLLPQGKPLHKTKPLLSLLLGVLFSTFFVPQITHAQDKVWDKRFGTNVADGPQAIIKVSTGGYLILGYTEGGLNGDKSQVSKGTYDNWLVRTDENGVKLWDKSFGSSASDFGYDIKEDADGNFIILSYVVGSTITDYGDLTSPGRGGIGDYWLIKISPTGTKLWDKPLGTTGIDAPKFITIASDGNYIITGNSTGGIDGDKTQANLGGWDKWIVKVNKTTGAKIWDKTFGTSDNDYPYESILSADGGLFIVGLKQAGTASPFTYNSNILKLNSSGTQEWYNQLTNPTGASANNGPDIFGGYQDTDGGFLVFQRWTIGVNNIDLISKFNSSGVKLWDKQRIDNTASPYSSTALSEGGFAIVKKTNDNQIIIEKWDADCELVSITKPFGGSGDETPFTLLQVAVNDYVVLATTDSPISGDVSQAPRGLADFWLLRISGTPKVENRIYIFQQPSTTSTSIGAYYDITANTWTAVTAPPFSLPYGLGDNNGTNIYSFQLNAAGSPYLYKYNPAADVWSGVLQLHTTDGAGGNPSGAVSVINPTTVWVSYPDASYTNRSYSVDLTTNTATALSGIANIHYNGLLVGNKIYDIRNGKIYDYPAMTLASTFTSTLTSATSAEGVYNSTTNKIYIIDFVSSTYIMKSWDITTQTFTTLATRPSRTGGTGLMWDGGNNIYQVTATQTVTTNNELWKYSISANTWTLVSTFVPPATKRVVASSNQAFATLIRAAPACTITATAAAKQNTCTSNADATITLSTHSGATKVAYSLGSTFTGTYAGALDIMPAPFTIANKLPNPAAAQAYTIRLYCSETSFTDQTVTLQPKSVGCN